MHTHARTHARAHTKYRGIHERTHAHTHACTRKQHKIFQYGAIMIFLKTFGICTVVERHQFQESIDLSPNFGFPVATVRNMLASEWNAKLHYKCSQYTCVSETQLGEHDGIICRHVLNSHVGRQTSAAYPDINQRTGKYTGTISWPLPLAQLLKIVDFPAPSSPTIRTLMSLQSGKEVHKVTIRINVQ